MSEVIKLKYPIEVDAVQVTSLQCRRVTVGDLELMGHETGDIGKSIKLISLIASIAPEDVRKLDASDFNQLSELVADFLE